MGNIELIYEQIEKISKWQKCFPTDNQLAVRNKIQSEYYSTKLINNSNTELKYHYIYRTTNLVNSKTYVGKHYGKLKDSYLGSGVALSQDLRLFDKFFFVKEIVAIAQNETEVNALEKKHVDIELEKGADSYNLIRADRDEERAVRLRWKIRHYLYPKGVEPTALSEPLSDEKKKKLFELCSQGQEPLETYNKYLKQFEHYRTKCIPGIIEWNKIQEKYKREFLESNDDIKKRILEYNGVNQVETIAINLPDRVFEKSVKQWMSEIDSEEIVKKSWSSCCEYEMNKIKLHVKGIYPNASTNEIKMKLYSRSVQEWLVDIQTTELRLESWRSAEISVVEELLKYIMGKSYEFKGDIPRKACMLSVQEWQKRKQQKEVSQESKKDDFKRNQKYRRKMLKKKRERGEAKTTKKWWEMIK